MRSKQSALEACQLLFLDIQYAGDGWAENSYEDQRKIPKLPVVLVTAYNELRTDGYKV